MFTLNVINAEEANGENINDNGSQGFLNGAPNTCTSTENLDEKKWCLLDPFQPSISHIFCQENRQQPPMFY
jgi:hypothetical protein